MKNERNAQTTPLDKTNSIILFQFILSLLFKYIKNTKKLSEEVQKQKEGELIQQYRPILNTQIPKAEDWHKWEVNPVNAEEVLKLLLEE